MTTVKTSEGGTRSKMPLIVAAMLMLLLGIVVLQRLGDPTEPNRTNSKRETPIMNAVGPER